MLTSCQALVLLNEVRQGRRHYKLVWVGAGARLLLCQDGLTPQLEVLLKGEKEGIEIYTVQSHGDFWLIVNFVGKGKVPKSHWKNC